MRDGGNLSQLPVRSRRRFSPDPTFAAARERFRYFALALLGNVMDIEHTLAPVGAASAEPKRSWISPAVQDLGSMRQLTLLLQDSGIGGCDFTDPDCEF